jgi:GTP-binding protein HflX
MFAVNETLKELGVLEKPIITVFNKIDAYKNVHYEEGHPESEEVLSLEDFQNSWMGKHKSPAVFISAEKKENIEELKTLLYEKVRAAHVVRYPYNDFLY